MYRFYRLWLAILLTFGLAMFLTLVPLPGKLAWLNPDWLILCLLAWAMLAPKYVSFTFAWLLGLLMDSVMGTLLGLHPLALIILIYVVRDWLVDFLQYNLLHQLVWITGLTGAYQGVIYWMQHSVGHMPNTGLYWLRVLSNPLVWLGVFYALRHIAWWAAVHPVGRSTSSLR